METAKCGSDSKSIPECPLFRYLTGGRRVVDINSYPPSDSHSTSPRWIGSLGVGLLIICASATYASTLSNGFVLDDEYILVTNQAIRNIGNAFRFFFENPPDQPYFYRPIVLVSLAIDHAIWGLNPVGYHLTNLVLHVVNCVVVLMLLSSLTGHRMAAWLGALLFATHPVHGEAIYLVVNRGGLISALFYFLGLLLYVRRRYQVWSAVNTIALGAFFFLSLVAKEDGATLPIAMLALDLLVPASRRFQLKPYLSCVVAAIAYLSIRFLLCQPSAFSYFGGTPGSKVFMTMIVMEAYALSLLAWPRNLAGTYGPEYILHPNTWAEPVLWLSAAIILAVLTVGFYTRRRARLVSFSIAFYFIALAPTYQIVRLWILFGERFLYLASFGFCLLMTATLVLLSCTVAFRWAACAVLAIGVFWGIQTHVIGADWKDPESIWRATVFNRPNSVQSKVGLAMVLQQQQRCAEALPYFLSVLKEIGTNANDRIVYGMTASCFSRIGRQAAALAVIERWLAARPDDTGFRIMRDTLAPIVYKQEYGTRGTGIPDVKKQSP